MHLTLKQKLSKRITGLICLLILTLSFTACSDKNTEKGKITYEEHEYYYAVTDCEDEIYKVEEDTETESGHRVILESNSAGNNFENSPPGSYLVVDLSDDEYTALVDGMPIIEADFSVVTIADPETGGICTFVNETDFRKAMNKMQSVMKYSAELPEERIEKYISRWKLIYYRFS